METRANYIMVGSFMMSLFIGVLLFTLWISRFDFGKQGAFYDIFFEGSVTGLRENEDVRYHGIPIGKIKKIDIDDKNPNLVRVRTRITEPHLMREDVIASIEAQGLTGYSYVQIQGGDPNSPLLAAKDEKTYPVIASQPSRLDLLFSKAPYLLSNMSELTEQLKDLFKKENRQEVQDILKNMSILSTQLATGQDSLTSLVKEMKKTLSQANQAITSLSGDLGHSLKDVSCIIKDVQSVIEKNQGGVSNALSEVPRTLKNIRIATDKLQKLTTTFEQNPLDFLNRSPEEEYKIP